MSPSHFLRPRSSQSPWQEEDAGAASHPRRKRTKEQSVTPRGRGPRSIQTPLEQETSPDPSFKAQMGRLQCKTRTWKQPRCPSTEEWIRKMWYIYTMKYYAAEKNNDFMKFAGKWMELENVIVSKVSMNEENLVHTQWRLSAIQNKNVSFDVENGEPVIIE
ncbi:hypothetical protein STEG23_020239, partial [Scotinomys teguina]